MIFIASRADVPAPRHANNKNVSPSGIQIQLPDAGIDTHRSPGGTTFSLFPANGGASPMETSSTRFLLKLSNSVNFSIPQLRADLKVEFFQEDAERKCC